MSAVRWDALFADLESRLAAEDRLAFEADVADLTRAEFGALKVLDRLRSHASRELRFRLVDGTELAARPVETGADWVLLGGRPGDTVLPLAAVTWISGLSRAADVPAQAASRLTLSTVLRGLARDRIPVMVWTLGSHPLTGTIDRVGADHIDLALHPQEVARTARAVSEVRCVSVPALLRITAS